MAKRATRCELPYIPPFLHKDGGLVLSHRASSLQWVGAQLMATGTVQIWPGTPGAQALIEDERGDRRAAGRPGRGQAGQSRAPASCPAWTCAPR